MNLDQEETIQVYGLAGLPGAGKTTAAMILAGETDGCLLQAGKAIREMAEQEGLKDPTSSELGQFAADKRHTEGPGFFGEYALDQIVPLRPDEGPVVIDSFRHRLGVEYVSEYQDVDMHMIWVEAPREARLHRITARSRDDEGSFDMQDLIERDELEMYDLGVETLMDYEFDTYIGNDRGRRHLWERLDAVADFGEL